MPDNHATCPLSTLCIVKIHQLGPGSNPQPSAFKASDQWENMELRKIYRIHRPHLRSCSPAATGHEAMTLRPRVRDHMYQATVAIA
ncbi:hypothetical protein TNCV_1228241 [Trichonephila clavipes]|nr:hypothetical protein TNCV_1228241 [Trichonephila clavipes]